MRVCTLVSVLLVFAVSCGLRADDVPGLAKTKPAEGPAVALGDSWMVPYETTIPGTDVTFRMIPVPGGEYTMGSPENEPGRNKDEGPQRKVKVAPFWMSECEVTWAEYKVYMQLYRHLKEFQARNIRQVTDANKIDAITAPTPLYEPDFTFEFGDEPKQPAVSMTQYSARQYTKWLSAISGQQFRLPTEAEWEYACRAGSDKAYSFGDDAGQLGDYAWFAGNSEGAGSKIVRQKKPNAFGLYDMHGNVAEWVIDGYLPYAPKDLVDAEKDWARTDRPDPRTVRGGSWEFPAEQCRSASRLGSNDKEWKDHDPNRPYSPWWFTSDPARGVGFRLLRPATAMSREDIENFWKIDSEDIQFDVGEKLSEGRGVQGIADKELPAAIKALEK